MQFLFKIQIYNKNNNTWRNLYHTPFQPSTNISQRAYGPRSDIGVSGLICDTDFAMYYSLFKSSIKYLKLYKCFHNSFYKFEFYDLMILS